MSRRAVAACMALALAVPLAGCTRSDPTVILGKWRAEKFAFDSVKVPIAPNFEITRNEMILKAMDGTVIQSLRLSEIRGVKDTVEVELADAAGISLVFFIENSSRVHFKVPFVGTDIAFDRQP